MTDTPTQRPTFMELATEAVAFNKIVVVGLLIVLTADIAAAFYLASHTLVDAKTTEFTLTFFKDCALIIVGALAGLLQHKEG